MTRTLGPATLIFAVGLFALPLPAIAQQSVAGQQEKSSQEKPPSIYDEQADAAAQISEALARAERNNTRVLIQWGADWCSWCHLLHAKMKSDRTLARTILYEYEVVLIDVGRFDRNLELAKKLGADFKSSGVPYLTILDSAGDVIINQETEFFEADVDGQSGHDAAKLDEFLQKHRAEYLSAATVLSEAMREATKKDKLIFLHFGAPWCGWCHRLEDWAHSEEVEKILSKDFIDVKIDIDRMLGAKELQKNYRANTSGGIPWFAFVDSEGELLVTSEVNGTNLGCPWTDEEKAAFRKLLARFAKNAKPEELDTIVAKLGPQKDAG